jgi:predicted HTH domain antitoxin
MSDQRALLISQDILDAARLTAEEAKQELALSLYASGRLSIGKARELASMTLWEFRQLLATRRIPPHYTIEDLQDDWGTLQDTGRL